MKVTIIVTDGYNGWFPSRVLQGEVAQFEPADCHIAVCEALKLDKEEYGSSLKSLYGGKVSKKGNVITCNGDEEGVMIVAHA